MDSLPTLPPGLLAGELFQVTPDGVVVVDTNGTIVMINPVAAEMFGASQDVLVGSSVDELIPRSVRGRHKAHRDDFAEDAHTRPMGVGLDLEARRVDGTTFPTDISLSPFNLDGQPFVMAAIRDVSERKMADRELRVANERIAMMEDRERIARDLHDTVIQEIFAAGLTIHATLGRVTDAEVSKRLLETAERLDDSISRLRSVIFDLRRPSDHDDTRMALGDLMAAATRELGFAPSLLIQGDALSSIDPAAVDHLMPTLREALTNVGKHASATGVTVAITVGNDVTLTVADNGAGIESSHASGFGLTNMSERAVSMGGSFSIGRAEGGGTRMIWKVPKVQR